MMLPTPRWARALPTVAGAVALLLGVLAGCGEEAAPEPVGTPSLDADLSGPIRVEITTNKGSLAGELYPDVAPLAVASFVHLAEQEYFDGVIFHRILPGFVVQTGDPTGTGAGGPGYQFPDEPIPANLSYQRGTLAMANSGPNTNGSQFFLISGPNGAGLPPQYSLFGKVVSGLDVVDAMQRVDTDRNDRPLTDVTINSVTITESD